MCGFAAAFPLLPPPLRNVPRLRRFCGVWLFWILGAAQRMGVESVYGICLAVTIAVTAVADSFMPLSSSEQS